MKVTAAIGEFNWALEGYLSQIGNLNVLAVNNKLHMTNAMVMSNLTFTQVSRSQQLLEN